MVLSIFRADLRVTSKEKALEFYKGVKSVLLIPYGREHFIRVEPEQHISVVSKKDIETGTAPFVPAWRDEDGKSAYELRKYINAYLGRA